MKDRHGAELTNDDLTPQERELVGHITRTIEIAAAMAAPPDQIMPIARLLTLARTAAATESIVADMERLREFGPLRSRPWQTRSGLSGRS